ncbi:MAG: nicotinic acid mononucleotide adenylyltransferase, partial [Caulobacterales bacterium 32-69-10]
MKRARLPGPAKGLAIGLLGGSFNPAHEGHLLVAETAMKRLKLDQVWWVVARGNPLKSDHGAYAARLASARTMARGAGMRVSDIEAQLGLTYSIDTLRALRKAAPETRFVWLMGADNL